MSPLQNLVSLTAAIGALAYTSAAAADVTSTTVTNQPTQAQPVQQVQTQPAPVIIQQQPAPAQTSTTTTTAAPYAATYTAAPTADQYSEKSVETRPNKTLLKTGLGVLIVSYASSAVAGVASTRDSDGYLLIPLVGPWLDLGNRNCGASPCGDNENTNRAAIITAGVFQTAGALLTIGSFLIPEGSTVKQERRTVTAKAMKPEVHVTPVSFAAGGGIGAVGRF